MKQHITQKTALWTCEYFVSPNGRSTYMFILKDINGKCISWSGITSKFDTYVYCIPQPSQHYPLY